ncbi:MAG: hypothetical protein IAE77_23375 [Prosthecobacter sp.]|uniref:ArnT family glycosyltransferase n=1 Tax=Prosthecobacter sp. TaxID=1965333 RepID=UPI0019F02149|nr:hypothetical protein [Prosthecobacter sp.]MBE2286417.1 hypothetical protein [Prosthecobacter sp.]
MFVIAVGLLGGFSFHAGGFQSDLGGDPDEAAHAVTSLMVRDYLSDSVGQSPMKFARAYYEDFPRVALGHYPPLYYCIAGPLLLLRPSTDMLIALQVVTMAALATITFILGRHFLPSALAATASIGVCLLPVALKLTLHVMADVLLALTCLWAVTLWADYLRAPSLRKALTWGCVAAAAILTKGSGIGLCLVPPLGTLLAGRWCLMMTRSWWCSAVPVAVLAGPWMLYSTKISKEGMTKLTPWQYLLEALPFHAKAMPAVFGWPLTLLAVVAVCLGVRTWRKNGKMQPDCASLISMTVGMSAVLLLVPVGLTFRYMLTLAPAILLGGAAVLAAAPWSQKGRLGMLASAALLLILSLAPLQSSDVPPRKAVHGFEAAALKTGIPGIGGHQQKWLVASDPRGEGAIIAAAAFACPQRSPSLLRVYRGSKELARSDWMGRDYQLLHASEASLLKHLDELQVTRIFLDLSLPESSRADHENRLQAALESAPALWQVELEQSITREPWHKGRLLVYRRM